MKRILIYVLFFFLVAVIVRFETAHAGPTRVGNGDDGRDLESSSVVTTGILVETRDEAVSLLKDLRVSRIEGLGLLIPETEKAELRLIEKATDFRKTEVYARSFPEPHAATRFFPAALNLNRKQLVALHIHEALHRALPPKFRENEEIVSRITLAITSDGTSFDRVRDVVSRELQETSLMVAEDAQHTEYEGSQAERSNLLEYEYRSYFLPDAQKYLQPVSSLHTLKSFFYPMGPRANLGIGAELTFLILSDRSYMGPIGLSASWRLARWQTSDMDLFAALHLNTIADGEIKYTPAGRDTATVGVSFKREEQKFRLENQFYFTAGSEAKQRRNGIETTYRYGAMFGGRVRALGKTELSPETSLEWGGMGELLLANGREVLGGTGESTGRLRLLSVGPEFAYVTGDFRFSLTGRFVIDSTSGISFDQIGDLMGQGVGQGSWGAAVSWRF